MELPRLEQWEKRPDWNTIRLEVECPVCFAPSGVMCRIPTNPNFAPMFGNISRQRSEPHLERVWAAIYAAEGK